MDLSKLMGEAAAKAAPSRTKADVLRDFAKALKEERYEDADEALSEYHDDDYDEDDTE